MNKFATQNSTNTIKLKSMDVTALFTSVPIASVLDFLRAKILSNELAVPLPCEQFLSLVELCVNNNYFTFDGDFYKQKFGISMGSPLSPVLANLFMEHFEVDLLSQITPSPPLWLRYVDDVVMVWNPDDDFNGFHVAVNQLCPSIKFTTEWEELRSLPFLDSKIHRDTSGFSFEIYRKPTHSGQYLHFYSSQPVSVKRSTLFSLLLRVYRIADFPFLSKEIDILYRSFRQLGYPIDFINSVHSNVKRKFFSISPPTPRPDRVPAVCLPHSTFTEGFVKPMFRAQGLDVVSSARNTIKTKL